MILNRKKEITSRKLLNVVQIDDYAPLEKELKTYIYSKKELRSIYEAFEFAKNQHEGQLRKNNDPYICHPLSTAYYLAQLKLGPKTIIAGLLHDILEDTAITYAELKDVFGEEVANLVEAVTKVSYFAKENREQQKAEYLRKIYLSMAVDIRVIIIKLADRMHNMLTIKNLNEQKQQIIAKETLETYTAIAHRLGMKQVKSILEDLSFEVLNPEEYKKIEKLVETNSEKRISSINSIIKDIERFLRVEKHIKIIDIFGRPKTIYSIYRKMNQIGKSFDEITDLLAIRIIVNSADDCYKVLGYLHQFYTPVTSRFKDYIATPKNNVYQSLHTTLADVKGEIFEVQIRTEKMDKVAETGAAAHWAYKEGESVDINKKQKEIDEQIDLFDRIISLDQESATISDDSTEKKEKIEDVLKEDIFTSSIYVMTPNKKVVTLPFGSTVLDFAYRIHTEVGEHTTGAKINGVYSPINTVLKSGQIVEVKTSSKQKPTHEWLKIVVTSNARNRIKKYLTSMINETNIKDRKDEIKVYVEKTKNAINSAINQKDLRWKRKTSAEILESLKKISFNSEDDFLYAVYKGEYSIEKAIDLIYIDHDFSKDDAAREAIKSEKIQILDFKNDVLVDGIANLKTQLSSCCAPIPYESIVGYVSKGNGIKVHLSECINVSGDLAQRLVVVNWNPNVAETHDYQTTIKYYATDRPNLLYDVTKVLIGLKASTISANVKADQKSLLATGTMKIKVRNSDQLSMIISALKSVPAVVDVVRDIKKENKKND
ncbi:GTP diphosphokinase [Williamsoniiplasma somnilux]|uniref:Penta-phosphate guanosine-3'-pyrophosphohydrolase n=1 Tax=Williamsoniiplasma somnilux TaxID=215578 RepID=A0A2K8NY79_9MOLU|nr:RelA/SpoT family protein [Williamsoniiplasma somnilux]ATZ18780.1 GTP diphosphokinase [Williamsoniiplasma somnilux]